MPASRRPASKCIDAIAQTSPRVVEVESQRRTDDLIDEISQLLWAVSGLDPEAERLLKHSDYVANLAARIPE